jgi:hypothetical protein
MAGGIRLAIPPVVGRMFPPLPRLERQVARPAIGMSLAGVGQPVPEAPEVSPARAIRFGKMRRWRAMLFRRLALFRVFADHSEIRWQAIPDLARIHCCREVHEWPGEACLGIEFFQMNSSV